MKVIAPPRPARNLGAVVGGTLLGAGLVAAGLCLAFMTVQTPLVSRLVPDKGGAVPVLIPALVWGLAIIAGGALLVAGTGSLAATLASIRDRAGRRSPVLDALGSLPADVIVASGVVPGDDRPVPDLVIGPFGVALIDVLAPGGELRRFGQSWEMRTADGWVPAEPPVDRAARDAERVRRWLGNGDLDFVIRTYAAVVTTDPSIVRSPTCAVIAPGQIAAWIAALPRQRSLTAGRIEQVAGRVRESVATSHRRRGW